MPEIEFNTPPIAEVPNINIGEEETPQPPISEGLGDDTNDTITENGGLSQEELADPNSIVVTIADKKAPLVILFGPPSCGKTMTLIRLTRFLQKEGYTISPIRTFRPARDTYYKDLCDGFNKTVNSNNAAQGTAIINFMLVEVLKNGRRLCQILEAPGEDYFLPKEPNKEFPTYIHGIINSDNRKIWAFMVEPDWEDDTDRRNYVARIRDFKRRLNPADRAIFIFNKIDTTNYVRNANSVNEGAAFKAVADLYPGIFDLFINANPITRFINKYRLDFVPFQTGNYSGSESGKIFVESPRTYPEKLWNIILKRIRG